MKTHCLLQLVCTLPALALAGTAAAAVPPPFIATYQVLKDGSPLGEATVRLQPAGHGEWIYSKHMKGTAGLAALFGANLDERSRFAWKGDLPQAISYDYRLESAVKNKQRHLRADWSSHRVRVEDGKRTENYATVPGMVERNTTALAIGLALRDGQQKIALPVAVRQRVETQRFAVAGKDSVTVPAGAFAAVRVERTDAARGFVAWYVPDRYVLPVKLAQHDGGNLTMQLVRFNRSPGTP